MEVLVNDYKEILTHIQTLILQTQSNISQEKVTMAWRIGEKINQHLSENNQDSYGQNLVKQLESDIGISRTVLYKMRSFYKAYPEIPNGKAALNWGHYRILSSVKDGDERKNLEKLVLENSWSQETLQEEVKKVKTFENADLQEMKEVKSASKITPNRGKLFSYKIKTIIGSDKYFIDCGFGIFREIEEKLPKALIKEVSKDGLIVEVKKIDGEYSIRKSNIASKQLHTYKAYLERVVDGDTIRVNIDLGFGIFQHEIIRLAKINAPEMKTNEGKRSKKILEDILQDVPFLVIKSLKTDIFGRYVSDIFLAAGDIQENNFLQQIANKGVYLNQLLIDKGAAQIF